MPKKVCSKEDCTEPAIARSWCKHHYNKWYNSAKDTPFTKRNFVKEAAVSPTTLDIAWAAGVFEGDGYCMKKGGSCMAGVPQKDEWLPNRLQELFGGSNRPFSTKSSLGSGPYRRWAVSGARARGFLMTIYKFCSPRRQLQIREALGCE